MEVEVNFLPTLVVFPLALDEVLIATRPPQPLKSRIDARAKHTKEAGRIYIPPPRVWADADRRKDWGAEAVVLDLESKGKRKVDLERSNESITELGTCWFSSEGRISSLEAMVRKPEPEKKAESSQENKTP
jgi:hypothetical protein